MMVLLSLQTSDAKAARFVLWQALHTNSTTQHSLSSDKAIEAHCIEILELIQ